jgi:succinate dehydrogenase / fumarate reductase flavoprotein subunit
VRHVAPHRGPHRRPSQTHPEIREEFWNNVNVTGSPGTFNQELERAGRVADFLEFAELMCLDALHREESCGGHFREEHQRTTARRCATTKTSATRPPGNIAAKDAEPSLHKEPLDFNEVHLTQRSYK